MGTPAKKARITKAKVQAGGLEGTVDVVGWLLFFLAIVAGIVVLVKSEGVLWFAALKCFFSAPLLRLICQIIAELLRIQKHAAGLPYGGEIAATFDDTAYVCDQCGSKTSTAIRCNNCEAEFENNFATVDDNREIKDPADR